jgi:hypothetical protein
MNMRRHLLGSSILAAGLLVAPVVVSVASAAVAVQGTPSAVRVTAERANVREAASTTATIIATVNRGELLDVVGVSGTWYRVRLRPSNKEGFIAMSTVEALTASTPAAPPSPAPATPPPPSAPPAQPRTAPATPAPRPAPPQAARPRTTAQASSRPWRIRGLVGGDLLSASAFETFSAILDTYTFTGLTAGAEISGGALPGNLFARVGFASFSAEGQRVFIVDGVSYGTGIPLTVTMKPIQIGGGVRLPIFGQPSAQNRSFLSRLTPYAGAGVVLMTYQEVSDFADDGDNDAERYNGLSLFGGVDVSLTRILGVALEAEYRQISGFGTGGVSEAFGEDQLGGTSFKFMVTFSK